MRQVMRVVAVALALVGAALVGAPAISTPNCPFELIPQRTYAPPAGKILQVIGQDSDSIDNYVAGTGLTPGGVSVYTSLAEPSSLFAPFDSGQGRQDAMYLLEQYPNSAIHVGLFLGKAVSLAGTGALDPQIVTLAQWIKLAERPVYLRIGFEFDGTHNAYPPADYIASFRRIVCGLKKNGAANVTYVWHSWAQPPNYQSRPFEDWYPGDEYVDWVGVSLFGRAHPPADLAGAQDVADFAQAHSKPLFVSESTPFGTWTPIDPGKWSDWFANVVDFIDTEGVQAFHYINANWESQIGWADRGWGDSRVEANTTVESEWTTEVTQSKYLHASTTLFATLGY